MSSDGNSEGDEPETSDSAPSSPELENKLKAKVKIESLPGFKPKTAPDTRSRPNNENPARVANAIEAIHPVAKKHPFLHQRVINNLHESNLIRAGVWSNFSLSGKFNNWLDDTARDEKPYVHMMLALMAARTTLRHGKNDKYGFAVKERDLVAWTEKKLRSWKDDGTDDLQDESLASIKTEADTITPSIEQLPNKRSRVLATQCLSKHLGRELGTVSSASKDDTAAKPKKKKRPAPTTPTESPPAVQKKHKPATMASHGCQTEQPAIDKAMSPMHHVEPTLPATGPEVDNSMKTLVNEAIKTALSEQAATMQEAFSNKVQEDLKLFLSDTVRQAVAEEFANQREASNRRARSMQPPPRADHPLPHPSPYLGYRRGPTTPVSRSDRGFSLPFTGSGFLGPREGYGGARSAHGNPDSGPGWSFDRFQ